MKENKYRSAYCGDIKLSDKNVKIAGWVENIRDHGGLIFVDVRDETGIIQIVSNDAKLFNGLTRESTVTVSGLVRSRNVEDYNSRLKTGEIEVLVEKLEILGSAPNELPFEIITSPSVAEELRLKYRYLDLRNEKVHNNIIFRTKVIKYIRSLMDDRGFTEIQTPIITASSPEGARDFIIPSRKHKGKFYALPQAPQIFKELLMVSGFDKYYQIAPCFRDEDSRSDRTLEFYQLDLEMAFVEEEDVYEIGEEVFYNVFKEFGNKEVSKRPFKRISYKDAMLIYGTDKPDLRNPLEIKDASALFAESEFKPFRGSIVRTITVENIADKPNSWFNDLVSYASSIGMPGIGYLTLDKDNVFHGPIEKFMSDEDKKTLIKLADLKKGSVVFFIADKKENIAAKQAGMIRTELGKRLDLIDNNKFEFCIVNDFPIYEYNTEEKKYDFSHNPFSMPKGGINALDTDDYEKIIGHQYDFVCNGHEMASGAIRNHDVKCLEKAFSIVGYDKEVLETRFKSLYNAFQYGVPPHGGMAPGIDRIIMLLLDEPNLREVQVFPLSVSGVDLMMGCPSEVSEQQLRETHIKLR